MPVLNGNGNSQSNGTASAENNASLVAKKILSELLSPAPGKGSEMDPQVRLYHAKMDLEILMELQTMFGQMVAGQKQTVERLLLEISPLMSLDDELLTKVASYQDEEALLELERTMTDLMGDPDIRAHDAFTKQWKYLVETRQFPSNYIDYTNHPKQSCLRFVTAQRYARKMEVNAMYHYNPRQYIGKDYEWPEKLYSIEQFQQDFGAWDSGDEPPPTMELFLRISYREGDADDAPTRVLLEGFLSEYSDLDPWDRPSYTVINLGTHDTGAHMVFQDISVLDDPETMGIVGQTNWRGKRTIEWPALNQKAYMKRIAVTCLACHTHPDTHEMTPKLLVATRGYKSSHKDGLAIMPPRPYLAKARTANLLNCVNVGIQPTIEGRQSVSNKIGFRLKIDWGTQENFVRRKSILDAF